MSRWRSGAAAVERSRRLRSREQPVADPGRERATAGADGESTDASGQTGGGVLGRVADTLRRTLYGIRTRIVASFVILLAFSTLVSVLAIRQVLLVRLDQRVESMLSQEMEEFAFLAERGVDPVTGEPFREGPLERLFQIYLSRNIPAEGEELLAFADGRFYDGRVTQRASTAPLEESDELSQRWATLETVEAGELETSTGEARYIARPVSIGDQEGTFVVANFIAGEQEEVAEAVVIVAAVGGMVLLIGSALGFFAASRVLKPVRDLDATAKAITETDLMRRIRVEGRDELAELGRTFNTMLDRLETAFDSQREFIRDAGHELRTPITIVRGHLELMGDDPDERRQTVDLVTDELDRMSRFVADLSLLARAERTDFLHFETVDLRSFAEELLSKASALAPREWRLDAAPGGVVVADRQRLTDAVMNLADNAAGQTSEGDEIALGASVDGQWAKLWVADSGPGVKPEDRARIFDRFERGSGPSRYAGSGLGLAIVRAVAEAHGGSVWLERGSDNGGARFTIRIPIDQRYEEAAK